MGVSVPTVTFPVGINSEVIRHGETGFGARDAASWKELLCALAADPALREKMGTAGRERVQREYSLDAYAEWYRRILKGLAEPAIGEWGPV